VATVALSCRHRTVAAAAGPAQGRRRVGAPAALGAYPGDHQEEHTCEDYDARGFVAVVAHARRRPGLAPGQPDPRGDRRRRRPDRRAERSGRGARRDVAVEPQRRPGHAIPSAGMGPAECRSSARTCRRCGEGSRGGRVVLEASSATDVGGPSMSGRRTFRALRPSDARSRRRTKRPSWAARRRARVERVAPTPGRQRRERRSRRHSSRGIRAGSGARLQGSRRPFPERPAASATTDATCPGTKADRG
jgi:hypothetical protein